MRLFHSRPLVATVGALSVIVLYSVAAVTKSDEVMVLTIFYVPAACTVAGLLVGLHHSLTAAALAGAVPYAAFSIWGPILNITGSLNEEPMWLLGIAVLLAILQALLAGLAGAILGLIGGGAVRLFRSRMKTSQQL